MLQIAKIDIHKEYGARNQYHANDIALVKLLEDVTVTPWTLPVCVDWAGRQPPLHAGEEGTVSATDHSDEDGQHCSILVCFKCFLIVLF